MYKIIGGDGRQYGPASADEVRQWLAQGRIHAQTLVQAPPDQGWRPLYTFAELLPPPQSFAPLGMAPTRPSSNPMATWGFGLGLVSLFCSCLCCCGCPVNFLALLFSTAGLLQAQRENDGNAKTLALIGLICSLLSVVEMIFAGLISGVMQAVAHGMR
jgi:hypothetical protein